MVLKPWVGTIIPGIRNRRQSQWKSDDQWNEDKSNASSAWDWQQPKRQSEADWSTSTPKKLRTENYQSKWDHIGSPTGYPPHVGSSVDKNLPPTFQSDSEFYDKNEIWGKKLPRKVMTHRMVQVTWAGWQRSHQSLLARIAIHGMAKPWPPLLGPRMVYSRPDSKH